VLLQSLALSVSFIEAVVSTMIATLYGGVAPPLMAAVAVAVSGIERMPSSSAKYGLMLTCCFTAIAFAFAGATQGIASFVRVARHFIIGYPETIVTFGRLPMAFKPPDTALYWNARSFLYQLGTIKLVLRGAFDGTRQEAYGRADCEPAAAG
jgi:hypothetical protein